MKIIEQPDGLEGYVILVEQADLDRPLELLEIQGEWVDIIEKCEGVVLKGGLFHCVYLTNNEFAIEFLIPDEEWIPTELRMRLNEHLI
jgi:hypothetical protein